MAAAPVANKLKNLKGQTPRPSDAEVAKAAEAALAAQKKGKAHAPKKHHRKRPKGKRGTGLATYGSQVK